MISVPPGPSVTLIVHYQPSVPTLDLLIPRVRGPEEPCRQVWAFLPATSDVRVGLACAVDPYSQIAGQNLTQNQKTP